MSHLKHRPSHIFALDGLIHVSGLAGSGKTLLAVAFAANATESGQVEWICTDGKKSIISHLKQNVHKDNFENVTLHMPEDYHHARESIMNLIDGMEDSTSLIVIDPITRVLDLSHRDSLMWGQELIEEILPTLAGLVRARKVTILVTSESRLITHEVVGAVLGDVISKWADCHLTVTREHMGKITKVMVKGEKQPLAYMTMDRNGVTHIEERTAFVKEGSTNC